MTKREMVLAVAVYLVMALGSLARGDVAEALGRTWVAVWMVESGGRIDPPAGDGGKAVGPLQIWECRVDDVNRICRLGGWPGGYTYEDRRDVRRSMEMFVISCLHYHPDGGPEQWARHWNGGPINGPQSDSTLGYWRKVRQVPALASFLAKTP